MLMLRMTPVTCCAQGSGISKVKAQGSKKGYGVQFAVVDI